MNLEDYAMKYPIVIFFRHDEYADIDTYMNANKEKLECTLHFTSDKKYLNNLFDCNFNILVTYGKKTDTEYIAEVNEIVPDRMRLRWIHFETIDIPAFNSGVNFCYIHNVLKPHVQTRPVFSVATTCYNSYDKIHRCYNSIKSQTLKDWEWVVLDDSPDDRHFEFMRKVVGGDKRVRLYRRSENSGNIGNVKNEVVSLCRGSYVLEMDHDDEIVSDCLADAAKVFEDPEVGFVYMDFANIYENGNLHSYGDFFGLGYSGYYRQKYKGKWINVVSTPNINNITLSHIVSVPNHPRIWRRSTLNELGNYSEFLPICDDLELLLRTAVKTKMVRIPKVAYIQYMNENNNNFSIIRNSEINRLTPYYIVPQAYEDYKIQDRMKELNAHEDEEYMFTRSQIWKRENYTPKFCNKLVSLDYDKQYCIMGARALWDHKETIGRLSMNNRNDFLVLDNVGTTNQLCSLLDGLGFSRFKCYVMTDCSGDDLLRYFTFMYVSTEFEVIYSADSNPRMTSLVPKEPLQEQTSDTASAQ
jgi:glycosyltransferase involved in cell wall biosynthesis